jgi:hypothetical protein
MTVRGFFDSETLGSGDLCYRISYRAVVFTGIWFNTNQVECFGEKGEFFAFADLPEDDQKKLKRELCISVEDRFGCRLRLQEEPGGWWCFREETPEWV